MNIKSKRALSLFELELFGRYALLEVSQQQVNALFNAFDQYLNKFGYISKQERDKFNKAIQNATYSEKDRQYVIDIIERFIDYAYSDNHEIGGGIYFSKQSRQIIDIDEEFDFIFNEFTDRIKEEYRRDYREQGKKDRWIERVLNKKKNEEYIERVAKEETQKLIKNKYIKLSEDEVKTTLLGNYITRDVA